MNMVERSICGLTAGEIFDLINPEGVTMKHAVSVSNYIYKKHNSDISLCEKIPKKLREILSNRAETGIFFPIKEIVSIDKSVKYLFRTGSGKEFETVYI